MRYTGYFFIVAVLVLFNTPAGAVEPQASPYGVCSHLVGHEFDQHEKTMRLMQTAGIQWARADFSWCGVQPAPDTWDFKRVDVLLSRAPQHNIQILPILDYNNHFADPAWQHLDEWELYVRTMVERYQDRLPVWEIWNEQNGEGFWKDPNPEHYLALLKRSYETIKSVNPDLKVAVGGYAGIPYDYIEELYQLGGGQCFDIMNVHPYSHPLPPEQNLEESLQQLKDLMAKYGDDNKPIWATEIGWPTHEPEFTSPGLLQEALKCVLPEKSAYRIVCIKDPESDLPAALIKRRIADHLPANGVIEVLDYETLATALDRGDIDVVVMPPSENYYLDGFDRIVRYVKEGGTVVDLQGMPFWYGFTKNEKGAWEKTNTTSYNKLRIQAEAWWYNKGIIPEEMTVEYAGPVANLPDQPKKIIATRFLQPYQFKEGDRFIPLLRGKNEKYTGTAAAIFDFDSDWKGAVIVNALREGEGLVVNQNGQAEMLTRSQLMARRCGVERIFWYEFQAPEQDQHDKESHFGIVHNDYTEKPAYSSYKTLTSQLPAGSTFTHSDWHRTDKSLYYPQWKLTDGSSAGAIWSYKSSGTIRVEFSGARPSFTTHTGSPLSPSFSVNTAVLDISSAPVYFQGAEIKSIDAGF
ncbi:beta-galactosidase [Aeoliella mucimassa]|uniref:Beta-xylosidase n=1 Tax=Aeoliella mucimassa TaxID=2527972 RepID=A0A518ARN1_9BACT|nr:beta-galactosidase [Aeoliella mucimassa]QDU57372.1 Beta-xylosidase [Aeoliella mucimassa]